MPAVRLADINHDNGGPLETTLLLTLGFAANNFDESMHSGPGADDEAASPPPAAFEPLTPRSATRALIARGVASGDGDDAAATAAHRSQPLAPSPPAPPSLAPTSAAMSESQRVVRKISSTCCPCSTGPGQRKRCRSCGWLRGIITSM